VYEDGLEIPIQIVYVSFMIAGAAADVDPDGERLSIEAEEPIVGQSGLSFIKVFFRDDLRLNIFVMHFIAG
ncbi:hypothetical protein L0P09_10895, partial [Collinsella aerofaciens]